MQKDVFKQDITQCFFNAGCYKLELDEIEQAEKEAKEALKQEKKRWSFSSYQLAE